ncbi:MAG TPA: hypothetical protein VFW57_09240 [Acidimicrobiia bacterium]|nr:hypothetical protein [Acidimicrobiia bacterium]
MIAREQSDMGIDDVSRTSRGAQRTDRSGTAWFERPFGDTRQQSGEQDLAGAVSPGLGDTTR